MSMTAELTALHEAEAFLRSIVEQSRDCIKVLDLDARLLFMSKGGMATLEICDFVPIRGANWLTFWDGEDRVAATAAVDKAKAGTVGEFVGFFPLTQSKTPRWWHVVVSPIRDEAGRITSLLAVSRDVTEQRQLECELRRSIEARDQFLSIASHELRTPIASLKMQLDVVRRKVAQDGTLAPDRLARMFDVSSRQIDRLVELVDSMLDVARIREGRLALAAKRAELSDVVAHVFERFRDQFAEADTPVELELAPGLHGTWDASRLEQVVENLLANALKYARGSALHVATSGDERGVRLVVRDRGPGVPPDKRASIFERFERGVDRGDAVGGLGLGLYITKQIVEAHGGEICVDTTDGGGATFTVNLPREAAIVAA